PGAVCRIPQGVRMLRLQSHQLDTRGGGGGGSPHAHPNPRTWKARRLTEAARPRTHRRAPLACLTARGVFCCPAPRQNPHLREKRTQMPEQATGSHPPQPRARSAAPAAATAERMTGAQSLIRSLEAVGADTVFGIPGGAILPAYDPLMDSAKVRH